LDTESVSFKIIEEGQRQLQESLAAEKQQSPADRHRVPQADGSLKPRKDVDTLGAQVLEPGNILVERKKKRDLEKREKKRDQKAREKKK